MKNINNQSGFTIIETIIYIALFVLVMAAVVLSTYNMIASTDKAQYKSLVQNEGQFAIRKIHMALNNATSVSISGTTLTATGPSGPNRVVSLTGNKLQLDGVDLNGDVAPVTSLAFIANPAAGIKPVEVQMVFEMKNPYYSETFTSKKLVR
jgi:type II secretory pathway pseudopilin PulG